MNILNYQELCNLIHSTNCIDSDLIRDDLAKEYSKKSSIQPCSIDLHIGEMYIPEKKDNQCGGKLNPNKDEFNLKPGGSLLVRIEENMKLPDDIGGICYAPARYSLKGMLIVNIGHIDPGYEGKLHFTVINLGKENLTLRKGDIISTLLLFKLSHSTYPFGSEELVTIKNKKISKSVNENLPRLASTFMNFENTTSDMVKSSIRTSAIYTPIIAAIVTVLLTFVANSLFNTWLYNDKIEKRIQQLEIKSEQLSKQLDIEKRLTELEKNKK